MEQNFAKLFRTSPFVAYQSRIPLTYSCIHGKNYGLKYDLPLKQFPENAIIKSIDGKHGPIIADATESIKKEEFLRSLILKIGTETRSAYALTSQVGKNKLLIGKYLPPAQPVQVIGRLLNSLKGKFMKKDYAVGVCGYVCWLPNGLIPPGVRFDDEDCQNRRAFIFNIESIKIMDNGQPEIILSMNGGKRAK